MNIFWDGKSRENTHHQFNVTMKIPWASLDDFASTVLSTEQQIPNSHFFLKGNNLYSVHNFK